MSPTAPARAGLPARTDLAGLQVDNGTATVALSGAGLAALPARAAAGRSGPGPHPDPVPDGAAGGGPGRRPGHLRATDARDRSLRLAPIALAEPAPEALVQGDRLVVKGEASVYEARSACACSTTTGRSWPRATPPRPRAPPVGAVLRPAHLPAPASPHAWTVEAFEVSAEDGAIVYLGPAPGMGRPLEHPASDTP